MYVGAVNGGIWRPATLMKIDPAHAPQGRRAAIVAGAAHRADAGEDRAVAIGIEASEAVLRAPAVA